MVILKALLLAVSVTFLTACQGISKPQVERAVPDRAYFENLVQQRYVQPFRAGEVDVWLQAFDADAIALHNLRPADRGVEAIEGFGLAVHQYFKLDQYDVRITDVRFSQQWVYTVGEYTTHFVNKADGKAPWGIDHGKFVLLWELGEDGVWRIILDMGNSNTP
mgnify:FL=1|jgi:hypothetical protein|tara:strand:- start:8814 stop:9302 length:489 start_codon:yes stop_codon:yes gene_type:complete